jgi:cytochrome c oxidase subunit I+III
LRSGRDVQLQSQLWGVAIIGLAHCCALVWVWMSSTLAVTQTAHDAVIAVMLMYLMFHSGLAVIMTVLQAKRVAYGYVGKAAPYEVTVVEPWWLYTTLVFWVSFAAIVLLPIAWGGA